MWGWGEETAGRPGSWKETESRSCSSGEPCPKWRGKTPQAGWGAEPRWQGLTGARTLCNVLTHQGFLESPAENLKSLLVHAAPGPQKAGEETHSCGDLREHVCSLPGPADLAHVVCNSVSGGGGWGSVRVLRWDVPNRKPLLARQSRGLCPDCTCYAPFILLREPEEPAAESIGRSQRIGAQPGVRPAPRAIGLSPAPTLRCLLCAEVIAR